MVQTLKILLLVLMSNLAHADQLVDILAKHQQTLGDLSQWRNIDSVVIDIEIKEPSFEVKGKYYATRDGKMRIDIFADNKHVFSEAFNGKIGWQWSPDMQQPKIIGGAKAAALRHGVEMPGHIFTLLDMQAQGHQLQYIGDESREQGTASVVLLTLKDGHQKYYVLDSESGVILASRDQRAFHPDIDSAAVTIETRPSVFQIIAGMNRATRSDNYDLTNNQWLGTTKIVNTSINNNISSAFFEPEDMVPQSASR